MNLQHRIDQALHGTDASNVRNAKSAATRDAAREAFVAGAVFGDALEDRTMRDLLVPYLRREIQVNYIDPVQADLVLLAAVHKDTFTVVPTTGARYHFPYGCVLSITEHKHGLIVEVYRQVFVKGAVGFGFSVPIE